MNRTFTCLVIFILTLHFASCKKENSVNNPPKPYINFFPKDGSCYWKAYYNGNSVDTHNVQIVIDSIYVTEDTIGLNVVSNQNGISDTNWVVYNIIKVFRQQLKYFHSSWDTIGPMCFGLFRVDTNNNRVFSVNTACLCEPGGILTYPTNFLFNERVIFDYNMKDNDTAFIKAFGNNYHTTVHVDSFTFKNYPIKKQYFTVGIDTAFERIQFGCLFNTDHYTYIAIPKSYTYLNMYRYKMVFYDGSDSLIMKADTQILP